MAEINALRNCKMGPTEASSASKDHAENTRNLSAQSSKGSIKSALAYTTGKTSIPSIAFTTFSVAFIIAVSSRVICVLWAVGSDYLFPDYHTSAVLVGKQVSTFEKHHRAALEEASLLKILPFSYKLSLKSNLPQDINALCEPILQSTYFQDDDCTISQKNLIEQGSYASFHLFPKPFMSWDAEYFVGLALSKVSYPFDFMHAFFPGLPIAIYFISQTVRFFFRTILEHVSELKIVGISGVLLSNFCFVLAALGVYCFSAHILSSKENQSEKKYTNDEYVRNEQYFNSESVTASKAATKYSNSKTEPSVVQPDYYRPSDDVFEQRNAELVYENAATEESGYHQNYKGWSHWVRGTISYLSVFCFSFNASSVHMSAIYTESLYNCLAVWGAYLLLASRKSIAQDSRRRAEESLKESKDFKSFHEGYLWSFYSRLRPIIMLWIASLLFACAALTRSNGILLLVPLFFYTVKTCPLLRSIFSQESVSACMNTGNFLSMSPSNTTPNFGVKKIFRTEKAVNNTPCNSSISKRKSSTALNNVDSKLAKGKLLQYPKKNENRVVDNALEVPGIATINECAGQRTLYYKFGSGTLYLSSLIHWAQALILAIIVASPLILNLYHGYYLYCQPHTKSSNALQEWCSWKIPNIYGYIQAKYWNVRFAGSLKPGRLDRILYSSPTYFFVLFFFCKHHLPKIKNSVHELFEMLEFVSLNGAQFKDEQNLAELLKFGVKNYPKPFTVEPGLPVQTEDRVANTLYFWPRLLAYYFYRWMSYLVNVDEEVEHVTYLLLLLSYSLLFCNTEVFLRMSTSSPLLFLYAAMELYSLMQLKHFRNHCLLETGMKALDSEASIDGKGNKSAQKLVTTMPLTETSLRADEQIPHTSISKPKYSEKRKVLWFRRWIFFSVFLSFLGTSLFANYITWT